MRRWLDSLYITAGWLAAGCIAGICLLVVCQVLLNLIDRISTLLMGTAIGLTIPSYSDFTGFLLAAASFFALAYTLREGGHIRVVLVVGRLPEKMQKFVEFWCSGFGFAVAFYFCWYTAKLTYESYVYHDLSSGMIAVPLWIPQSAMLLGLLILTIALADELATVLSGGIPSYVDKGEKLLVKEDVSSVAKSKKQEETCPKSH
jgi:TRAP-type C4-dicarboxylate transport system permease small subunit